MRYQNYRGRFKEDSILEISGRKKKNTGIEIDNNKRGSVRATNCQKISRNIKDRKEIIKKAGIRDGDKIGDIRKRISSSYTQRVEIGLAPGQPFVGLKKFGTAHNITRRLEKSS